MKLINLVTVGWIAQPIQRLPPMRTLFVSSESHNKGSISPEDSNILRGLFNGRVKTVKQQITVKKLC